MKQSFAGFLWFSTFSGQFLRLYCVNDGYFAFSPQEGVDMHQKVLNQILSRQRNATRPVGFTEGEGDEHSFKSQQHHHHHQHHHQHPSHVKLSGDSENDWGPFPWAVCGFAPGFTLLDRLWHQQRIVKDVFDWFSRGGNEFLFFRGLFQKLSPLARDECLCPQRGSAAVPKLKRTIFKNGSLLCPWE